MQLAAQPRACESKINRIGPTPWATQRLRHLLTTFPLNARLPLVGEFPYSRGNEEFVGGRGNLRGKVDKMGELLENVRGFGQKSNEDK